jgi:hypothetical protein
MAYEWKQKTNRKVKLKFDRQRPVESNNPGVVEERV